MKEAGATYIARWTTVHARQVINASEGNPEQGIQLYRDPRPVPDQYGGKQAGRRRANDGVAQGNPYSRKKAEKMTPEELKGVHSGRATQRHQPEFSEYMRAVAAEASRRGEGG